MLRFISATLLSITPALSFAFFCPSNFNHIEMGYTIDQVIAACGKPNKEETSESKPEGPQEWNYYIPQTINNFTNLSNQVPPPGSLKIQMAFDASGKVVNISENGISVASSTVCGSTINLGDSRESVEKTCGKPGFVNKQNDTDNASNPALATIKVVRYTYNSNPPVVLVFENGKLAKKE